MNLNIGPGPFYAGRDWVNMDIEGATTRRDITGSLQDLPPDVCDVELAYLGHVLEHIPLGDLVPALSDLRDRMVPGGTIAVVGPDVLRAQDHYERGVIPLELLNTCRAHHNPEPGGSHLWDCDEATVIDLLTQAGFRDVHAVDISSSYELSIFPVVSQASWQCAVIAYACPTPAPQPATPTELTELTEPAQPTTKPAPAKRARKTTSAKTQPAAK